MTPITEPYSPQHRGFARLVFAAAVVTFLMITIGAITRVTESGMGCGTDWPHCNGKIIPEFADYTVVIEYAHRLFALLVGGFAVAVVIGANRLYRRTPRVWIPAVMGVVLFFAQSALGALTVFMSNQWVSVMLHLGNSLLMMACYWVAWVNAREPDPMDRKSAFPLTEVLFATVFTYIVVLVGAVVAGNYATNSCVGWPLCLGEVWPVNQGTLQQLNMFHRLIATLLGVVLLWLVVRAYQRKANRITRLALGVACAMYLTQSAMGAGIALALVPQWLQVAFRGLHVIFAATTWSAMVVLCGVSWLQVLQQKQVALDSQGIMNSAPVRSGIISS
jgi:heme A synthase